MSVRQGNGFARTTNCTSHPFNFKDRGIFYIRLYGPFDFLDKTIILNPNHNFCR